MSSKFTLYKYRDWNNPLHRRILSHDELYVPTVREINDPFDFKIPPDYSFLDTSEKQERYINYLIQTAMPTLSTRGIDPKIKFTELKSLFANDEYKQILESRYEMHTSSMIEQHYGICCFSRRWDSILMWTHYSSNHTGICIGFDNLEIDQLNYFGSGGFVDYKTEFPKIDPLHDITIESMFTESHTKAKDWEYEQEYRYVKLWEPDQPTQSDKLVTLNNKCIVEIVLGLRVSDQTKKEVLEIGKRRNIPVYEITKTRKAFKFDRRLLTV